MTALPDVLAAGLRDRILAEIERREKLTKTTIHEVVLGSADWRTDGDLKVIGYDGDECNGEVAEAVSDVEAAYIALHDPADALLRYAHLRDLLDEHEPCEPGECVDEHGGTTMCHACDRPAAKCRGLKGIAVSLGIGTS